MRSPRRCRPASRRRGSDGEAAASRRPRRCRAGVDDVAANRDASNRRDRPQQIALDPVVEFRRDTQPAHARHVGARLARHPDVAQRSRPSTGAPMMMSASTVSSGAADHHARAAPLRVATVSSSGSSHAAALVIGGVVARHVVSWSARSGRRRSWRASRTVRRIVVVRRNRPALRSGSRPSAAARRRSIHRTPRPRATPRSRVREPGKNAVPRSCRLAGVSTAAPSPRRRVPARAPQRRKRAWAVLVFRERVRAQASPVTRRATAAASRSCRHRRRKIRIPRRNTGTGGSSTAVIRMVLWMRRICTSIVSRLAWILSPFPARYSPAAPRAGALHGLDVARHHLLRLGVEILPVGDRCPRRFLRRPCAASSAAWASTAALSSSCARRSMNVRVCASTCSSVRYRPAPSEARRTTHRPRARPTQFRKKEMLSTLTFAGACSRISNAWSEMKSRSAITIARNGLRVASPWTRASAARTRGCPSGCPRRIGVQDRPGRRGLHHLEVTYRARPGPGSHQRRIRRCRHVRPPQGARCRTASSSSRPDVAGCCTLNGSGLPLPVPTKTTSFGNCANSGCGE